MKKLYRVVCSNFAVPDKSTGKCDGSLEDSVDDALIAFVGLTANTMNGRNITLSIMGGFEGVGTYDIGGGANVFGNASYTEVDVANPSDSETWVAPFDSTIAGKISVSEVSDTSIKGTFNFKGKNADGTFKEITEGSFDVNFQ